MIPIGRVIGPGEENGQIKIQTKDNIHTRIGEYLSYKTSVNGQEQEVFAIIISRCICRNLPANFMANPAIDASKIASALGLPNALNGIEYEITVNILGYFDHKIKSFVNPRINPNPNTIIYLPPDEKLSPVLFSAKRNEIASAYIGNMLLRPSLDVIINVDKLVSTHFAILAGTGSGKSYLTRVILEELMQYYNRAAIAVFDPHGEYETLSQMSNSKKFEYKDLARNKIYRPDIKILRPGQDFSINTYEMNFGDIRFLLPDITEKMSQLLEELINEVKGAAYKKNYKWTYNELLSCLDDKIAGEEEKKSNNKGTLEALRWRLNSRFDAKNKKHKLFVDDGGTPLRELFRPGQCTVIRLDGLEEREQQVCAAILLRKVYKAREAHKNDENIEAENSLEYPVFSIIEEAHRFAPSGENNSASNTILKTILSEGRKFGVGVGLITQRPGKLDQNVLSQCMTQFFMRIINPNDQESVGKSVEGAGRDLLQELPSLSNGQAIVSGMAVRTPVLLKVREAYTDHKGDSIESAKVWNSFFDEKEEARREMSLATRKAQVPDEDESANFEIWLTK